MMMRAALILGGLGVLTAMEFATPPRSGKAAVEHPLALLEAGNSRDTLTRSDRLEVAHLLREAPFQPLSPAATTPPAAPAGIDAQGTPQNIDPGDRAPAAVMLPRPRPRPTAPRLTEARHTEPRPTEPRPIETRHAAAKPAQPARSAGPDRPKTITETRSCANALAGLLKIFSLPSGCDT